MWEVSGGPEDIAVHIYQALYFQHKNALIEFGTTHALVPGVQASETADAVHEELKT